MLRGCAYLLFDTRTTARRRRLVLEIPTAVIVHEIKCLTFAKLLVHTSLVSEGESIQMYERVCVPLETNSQCDQRGASEREREKREEEENRGSAMRS